MDAKKRTPDTRNALTYSLRLPTAIRNRAKAGERKDDEHDNSKRSHHGFYPQYFRMGCRLPLFWYFFP